MEELLPVRMDSERRHDEHTLALALVIDGSGSMAGAKIELAKEAARATAELLSSQDALAVIAFASQPERVVRMQSASNRTRISPAALVVKVTASTSDEECAPSPIRWAIRWVMVRVLPVVASISSTR